MLLPTWRSARRCASPGSKTQQLLELLRSGVDDFASCGTSVSGSDLLSVAAVARTESEPVGCTGGGLLVANDASFKRSTMLASRASKLHSPELLVCCHDGRHLPEEFPPPATTASQPPDMRPTPDMRHPPDMRPSPDIPADAPAHAASDPSLQEARPAAEPMCSPRFDFDRVLCDVPCSGDGTLRKAPGIWHQWVAARGNQLHKLQLQLAAKAVRLLRVGGRLVYSTCSLNPIENEV